MPACAAPALLGRAPCRAPPGRGQPVLVVRKTEQQAPRLGGAAQETSVSLLSAQISPHTDGACAQGRGAPAASFSTLSLASLTATHPGGPGGVRRPQGEGKWAGQASRWGPQLAAPRTSSSFSILTSKAASLLSNQ